MKKLALLAVILLPIITCAHRQIRQEPQKVQGTKWNLSFTTGYVFKQNDQFFEQRFENGIQNIITVDACYTFLPAIGFGGKVSYWATKTHGTFLHNPAKLQEVPLTFYLRTLLGKWYGLQPYISLGGGAIFLAEKSYQESIKTSKGIGELELGLNWVWGKYFNITGVFRYLFPRETINNQKADIGGFDLRGGIGISF